MVRGRPPDTDMDTDTTLSEAERQAALRKIVCRLDLRFALYSLLDVCASSGRIPRPHETIVA